MTPTAILAATRDLGVTLLPEGDNIRIRPAGRIPPTLRAAVTAQKAALLRVLRGLKPADACNDCGSLSWTVSLVGDDLNRTCHDCATGRTALRRAGVPI